METATIVHTAACKKYTAIGKMRRTKFFRRYPNYCRTCQAFGFYADRDWEGEWDQYPCPDCLDKDICPRCGTATMVEKRDFWYTSTVYMYDTCSTCGWRGDDDFGDKYCVPQEWVCRCKGEQI